MLLKVSAWLSNLAVCKIGLRTLYRPKECCIFMTKENSCKPSWGAGWGACLHEEIYQDGNLSWQDQQAASWILITWKKRPGCTTFPFRLACQLLPMNAATAMVATQPRSKWRWRQLIWKQQRFIMCSKDKASVITQQKWKSTNSWGGTANAVHIHSQGEVAIIAIIVLEVHNVSATNFLHRFDVNCSAATAFSAI